MYVFWSNTYIWIVRYIKIFESKQLEYVCINIQIDG
jgi:hypothetical protein